MLRLHSRLATNSSDRTLRQFNLPTYGPPAADGAYIEQELEPTYRFSDPINKVAWHAISYSPDGEWLAGGEYRRSTRRSLISILSFPRTGAADNATHKIYIWDIANEGQFAAALDGGREPLTHVHVSLQSLLTETCFLSRCKQWHPQKPSIASTTNQGNILIWHCPTPERWGAFAGGFEEVDENVEYEEREDEFDIVRIYIFRSWL